MRSSGVHDAKARDVDGAIFYHFALPSVVHYLITAKYKYNTGGLIHEGNTRDLRDIQSYSCVIKVASLTAPILVFGILKGQSIVS